MTTTLDTINSLIEELGISMKVTFMPCNEANFHDLRLNYTVTLMHGTREVLTSPYSMGIGHIPNLDVIRKALNAAMPYGHRTICYDKEIRRICREGTAPKSFRGLGEVVSLARFTFFKVEPKLADVLHCLISDSDADTYRDFADWADSFDYDSDSIKAKAIYDTCVETGRKLRWAFGRDLERLRDAFRDY
jgi:hypothetical protein